MLLIGSVVGSFWMMAIFGVILPEAIARTTNLHTFLQFDGFITLIVMGISYMIIPRFRNISIPSVNLAYASYALIIISIILSVLTEISFWKDNTGPFLANICRILGVSIFCILITITLRTRPKLLKMTDLFIGLSIILFAFLAVFHALDYNEIKHNVLLWLMFPVMMIFGIEYKTLPSFIGFIWPRKTLSIISAAFLTLSVGSGIVSSFYNDDVIVNVLFRSSFLVGTVAFICALNIFAGFNTNDILKLSKGEKRARYKYTLVVSKLSFAFLLIGITLSNISGLVTTLFALYDLWIHIIAVGFIGLTVALYLPLMLSPILGRPIRFSYFSKLPIWLIIISLNVRTFGDVLVQVVSVFHTSTTFQYLAIPFSLSGWMIVSAILFFMFMIHRSMNVATQIFREDGTTSL